MGLPGTGRYGGGAARARQARSSHRGPSLQWAVSTTRRCMVPSCSIRVATTLISPFCARPAQHPAGRPRPTPGKDPGCATHPGSSSLPFPACPRDAPAPGARPGAEGFGGIAAPPTVPATQGDWRSPVQACRPLPFSSPDKIIVPVTTITVGVISSHSPLVNSRGSSLSLALPGSAAGYRRAPSQRVDPPEDVPNVVGFGDGLCSLRHARLAESHAGATASI
jgi:hypothetical protein